METTWTSIWRQSSEAHPEPSFAVILGKYTTSRLQDKMHDDPQWEKVDQNQKPLETWALLPNQEGSNEANRRWIWAVQSSGESTGSANNETNNQPISNAQCYKMFITRVDVAESVGVQFDIFRCMWEYCCCKSYLLIIDSSNTHIHENLKTNLLEAFIAKRDKYPATRSYAIALLKKYNEKSKQPAAMSNHMFSSPISPLPTI